MGTETDNVFCTEPSFNGIQAFSFLCVHHATEISIRDDVNLLSEKFEELVKCLITLWACKSFFYAAPNAICLCRTSMRDVWGKVSDANANW